MKKLNFIKISNRKIGPDFKPLVIFELGINHNGSLRLAKKIVDNAIKAGAEIIKHQTHIPEDEIFISDKTPLSDLKRVIMHEYVERAIMKVLELQYGMSPEQAWDIAHYFVKDDLGL